MVQLCKHGKLECECLEVETPALDLVTDFNVLEPAPYASGGFFTFPWKEERVAKTKTPTFKIVVKDGDTKYIADKKGQYSTKTVDYVQEFASFAEAIEVFAGYASDEYNDDKVSLVLIPAKK